MTDAPIQKRDLRALFAPRSVAIVGASADNTKLAGKPLMILKRHNFSGGIYPVNPNHSVIDGQKCYPGIAAIAEPVDLALIIVPAELVPAAMRECGAAGIRNLVIFSSGFEESKEGQEFGRDVKRIADKYAMNIVGPNSEGLWSVPSATFLTFGSAALQSNILNGPVSVLSQSGSIGGSTVSSLQNRGVGCRYFVSVGNETILGTLDYLDFMIDEGGSKVILIFIEGLKDGHRLREMALRAKERGIAIVMLKGGASARGRRVAASHTGKISAPQEIYCDIFGQCGIIQVNSISELAEAGDVLTTASLRQSAVEHSGRGIGIVAPGGSRVLISDECERLNVPLATFSSKTVQSLEKVIPSFGSAENPVDATGQVVTKEAIFEAIIDGIDGDPSVEALLVQYSNRGLLKLEEIRRTFISRRKEGTAKPVVLGFLGDSHGLPNEERKKFRDAGLLCAMGPDVAVKYLGWLYQAHRGKAAPAGEASGSQAQAPTALLDTAAGGALRYWAGQRKFLEGAGIALPRSVLLARGAGTDATMVLRFPLVTKALPEDADHKTEEGLVHLNIQDREALEKVVDELFAYKNGRLSAVLVQEMIATGYEAVVSVREDPDFGPIVSFGSGGTLVELWRDIVHLSIPCTQTEIDAALRRTKFDTLLGGLRGRPRGDRQAFVRAIAALCSTYLALPTRPQELELNPLVVLPESCGVVALDILVK